ncbi:MAG: FAD-binding monooxygenase, partial [Gammaproteobacteria bacterium]|nr:FAD-binding monooxygenase [Gammaproteobacteria bacterium]
CLGLWFEPDRALADAAADAVASLPIRLIAVGGDSGLPRLQNDDALARHFDHPEPGSVWLIRPDAYRAACLHSPTAADIAAAVRTALAQD